MNSKILGLECVCQRQIIEKSLEFNKPGYVYFLDLINNIFERIVYRI